MPDDLLALDLEDFEGMGDGGLGMGMGGWGMGDGGCARCVNRE